jgi:mono/diheme cytochrome c family protein
VTLTTAISAPAQIVNGDASMGQQLAQMWCNDCHAVGAEDAAEAYGSVPSFVLIAEMCFSIGGLNWRRLA